ncbi:MAG: hypothetical protein V3W34_19475 [Phycisphaerae bacterium]
MEGKQINSTAWHVLAVLLPIALGSTCVLGETVFYDGFDRDLSQWNIWFQNNYTAVITGSDGSPPPSLFLDDFGGFGTYATSKQTFNYVGRTVVISADMRHDHGDPLPDDQQYATLYLAKQNTHVAGGNIVRFYVRGSTHPNPNTVSCSVLYDDGGGETWEHSPLLAIPSGDGWHNAKMVIRSDGIVDFYVDHQWVYTSTHAIIPAYDGQAAVEVGERKSLYDNVTIVEPLFCEDFRGDLSQWNIWFQGLYTAVITGSDGNPPPSLFLDDFTNWGTYATSKQTISYAGRVVAVSADMRHDNATPLLDQRFATLYLAKQTTHAPGENIVRFHIRGSAHPSLPNTASCCVLYDDGGTETWECSPALAIPSGDGWHNAKMVIRSYGIVDFYVDQQWVYTSTQAIIPAYDAQAVVEVGERKSLYDNICVVIDQPPAVLPPNVTGGIASRYIRIEPKTAMLRGAAAEPMALRIECGTVTEWVELIRTDYPEDPAGTVKVNIGVGRDTCDDSYFLKPDAWTSSGANVLYVTGLSVPPGSKPDVWAVVGNCAFHEDSDYPATLALSTWSYCDSSNDGQVTFFADLFRQFSNTAGAGSPFFTGPDLGCEVDTQGDTPTVPDQQVTFFADIFKCFGATAAGGGDTWTGPTCP